MDHLYNKHIFSDDVKKVDCVNNTEKYTMHYFIQHTAGYFYVTDGQGSDSTQHHDETDAFYIFTMTNFRKKNSGILFYSVELTHSSKKKFFNVTAIYKVIKNGNEIYSQTVKQVYKMFTQWQGK